MMQHISASATIRLTRMLKPVTAPAAAANARLTNANVPPALGMAVPNSAKASASVT